MSRIRMEERVGKKMEMGRIEQNRIDIREGKGGREERSCRSR